MRGSIVEFKREGFVSLVLGNLLKLFERDWDFYGWHLGILWDRAYDGWYILEATGPGVKVNYYSNSYLEKNSRYWDWLDKEPTRVDMGLFLKEHINQKYDVATYFFTALAIIIRHYFNRPIPKLLDERFSCWELAAEFCADMGEPIVSKYDVILLPDLIKAFKEKEVIE